MKIIKITYTVNARFTETNRQNVVAFIEDVRRLNNPDIRYFSFLGEDGKTFTHLALYDNDDAQKQFLELPSFREFQQKRNASDLENPEYIEILELVAASQNVF